MLDTEDVLADVVLSPRTETIAAICKKKTSPPVGAGDKAKDGIKLRVITPALAQRHRELSDIPVLSETVAANTTLGQLKASISNQLKPANNPATATWILDLYMAGVPVTTQNLGKTVAEAKLDDASVQGVLNVYAIMRKPPGRLSPASTGKDIVFGDTECWAHPNAQSERGMAMLLSSLRVFTDRINARSMDQSSQDAILHVVHLLTNFPPAVRTTYILMSGRAPKPFECAALIQALYEVLRSRVISQSSTDLHNVLDPSRLLLGLVLEKAKQLKLAERTEDESTTPYFDAMQTSDLQASSPTLVGKEVYVDRLKTLCGMSSEVVAFDLDPNTALRYADEGRTDAVFSPQELTGLHNLALLAERNGLAVVAPTKLAQAKAPALTLDGEGLLAVYTGRTACAKPGEDFNFFRPTKNREEPVDVALTTQSLAPIIQQREKDGTTVYDSFGVGERRAITDPDEILMICVDTSRSMMEASDFTDALNDPDTLSSDKTMNTGQTNHMTSTIEEMRDLLVGHESWRDILQMLNDAPAESTDLETEEVSMSEPKQTKKAEDVIRMLRILSTRELHHNHALLSRIAWRSDANKWQSRVAFLEKFISGLDAHRQAICDFLVFRAGNASKATDDWIWRPGQSIPSFRRSSASDEDDDTEQFSISHEFLDPVSLELLEDPVKTTDGFVYGRKIIERWFQIRKTSPNTGLEVSDTTLTPATDLANRINSWIMAADILKPQDQRIPGSTSTHRLEIQIMTRTGTFNRKVTRDLTLKQLYQVVFRGMKGRYTNFSLSCAGTSFGSSRRLIASTNIRQGSTIHTYICEPLADSAREGISDSGPRGSVNLDEMCLIKVFDNPSSPLFSYWVPQDTTKSVASVLFKYWRYAMKHLIWCEIDDRHIYTDSQRLEDGYTQANLQNHWLPLSEMMNNFDAYGILAEEDLFARKRSGCNQGAHKPLVLKIRIAGRSNYSPETGFLKVELSRLDVLKQMFEAFTNRILAYNYQTHIGLITFDTVPKVAQEITHVFEDFRHTVNSMNAHGDTAIWDALFLANCQLTRHAQRFPQAKKRILCISDGMDTSSEMSAMAVCNTLKRNNVLVDSFCIGSDNNAELRTVSYILGGYKFVPRSLEQAMAICELEPVLTQTERQQVAGPLTGRLTHNVFTQLSRNAKAEVVTRDTVPSRKQHVHANDSFVRLSGFARSRAVNRTDSNLRTSRLHTEIKEIVARAHPYYDVYISESNMAFWKIVMQGPPGSSYAAGTFVLYLDMEEDYPAFPPKGRFMTPIHHPNINRHGRICHSIFDRNWTADTTNAQVLDTVYGLLMQPELTDPVNAVITLDYHHDEVHFQEEVRDHIAKHATKSRQQWCAELTGGH
ncbi:hypothetical protein K490DRAFT_41720 [Saccharata proteae CBS 121410]|uniref:peptidylprolyl isomerase n=1 Tax=Saccharata proteae CBS 121410 TaxID=1314787 RepID=A0A9P4HXA6_9PEZI|nr:hypothetical protein K490DRAFT_41720 [Saccharata proteae CBS 121410]